MSIGLGPELITNGTFDANVTGWSILGSGVLTWISGGTATFQRVVNANDRFAQDVNVIAGRFYLLQLDYISGTLDLTLRTSGAASFLGSSTFNLTKTLYDLNHGFFFTPTVTGTVQLSFGVSGAGTVGFDNISFREVQGGGGQTINSNLLIKSGW